MASFQTPGNPVPTHVTFNSGYLDFGSGRVVELDNLMMSVEWTLADLLVLGSIKPQFIARHSQKTTLTGKVKSFAPALLAMAAGSSNIGNPSSILTLDGQPTLSNPVGTFFDVTGNEFQYQFTGALFKSFKTTLKAEDYLESDFEMEALDVTPVMNAQ